MVFLAVLAALTAVSCSGNTETGDGFQTEDLRGAIDILIREQEQAPVESALLVGACEALFAEAGQVPNCGPGLEFDDISRLIKRLEGSTAVPRDDLVIAAIVGACRTLGDHHTYFSVPYDSWEVLAGFLYVPVSNGLLIRELRDGSSLQMLGVLPGDILRSINGAEVDPKSLDALLSFRFDSTAELIAIRPGQGQIRLHDVLKRGERIPNGSRSVERDIGVIRLVDFDFNQPGLNQLDDVERSMTSLKEKGITGWILDLRGNGGGSFGNAALVAGHFGVEDVLSYVEFRNSNTIRYKAGIDLVSGDPLVVLVDGLTGSAAEVVAEALRQRGVTIVGERTAGTVAEAGSYMVGKGFLTVRVGSVYVGAARTNLDGSGIEPDVEVHLDASELATGIDRQLQSAVAILRGMQSPPRIP